MSGGLVRSLFAASVVLWALPLTADATPLVVAGFTFEAGEQAFADDALVTSGVVTGTTDEQVRSTLVGSHLGDSIRVITPDVAVIEIAFFDNLIWNGDGNDFVIFELSGSATPVGFADMNERFEVSVLGGAGFSSFVEVVPVNTGFLAPHDASLSAYAVELDLANFGFAPGETTGSVRIRLVDHLVTRSADPTAIGALNSTPIPEPGTGFLMGIGLAGLAIVKRRRMPLLGGSASSLGSRSMGRHRPRAFPRATLPVGAYLAGASHRPGIAEKRY